MWDGEVVEEERGALGRGGEVLSTSRPGPMGSRKGGTKGGFWGGGPTHDLCPPSNAREWASARRPASREWCGTARTGCPGSLRLRGCFDRRRRNPGTLDHRQRHHPPREIITRAMAAAGRRADKGGGALRTTGSGRQGAGGKRESTVCTKQPRCWTMKRRSGCEVAADRPSVAADAQCHVASFPESSLIRDGTCRPIVEGGREEAMGGWEKGGVWD